MKRRHFLQFAGSVLTAMGLSQTGFLRQANRYGQVLAQSTSRKLALLIRINTYPDPKISDLSGCLTDVDMQSQLLVNRFGFSPSNILRLTDDSAMPPSRANILDEELIVPTQEDGVRFRVAGTGYAELMTLVSQAPLRGLLRSLQIISRGAGRSRGFVGLEEGDPLDLVTDLLGDLDSLSRSGNNASIISETVEESSAVDSGAIAAFSTIIEVVEIPNGEGA
ncbi:MAG: caspase family protein [Leptolyngbya sp. SIO1E4]|nr:caspase family protein [Leptolyngbya sp. SIO1E4]